MTPRTERLANLHHERASLARCLRELLGERHACARSIAFAIRMDARTVIKSIRSIDAKIAKLEPRVPSDIRTTILELCQTIDQGSTSALFGRVHDVRKWVTR